MQNIKRNLDEILETGKNKLFQSMVFCDTQKFAYLSTYIHSATCSAWVQVYDCIIRLNGTSDASWKFGGGHPL